MRLKFTYLLLALIVAVFILEIAFPQLAEELAFSGSTVASKPWTIVTALFVHADLEHLLANMVAIWFFGLAAEESLGKRRLLSIFFLGAFAGEAFSLLAYPLDALSLGASGGGFALLGAAMLVHPFLEMGSWSGVATLPVVFLAAVYIVYNAIGIFTGPADIAYGAHFAGLVVGLAFGYMHRKRAFRR